MNIFQADLTGNQFNHTSEYIGNIIEANREELEVQKEGTCKNCRCELKELDDELYDGHCSECFNG